MMRTSFNSQRATDVAESYHLLLELLASEPFLQECLQIIENTCLCRELEFTIDGEAQPSKKFRAFINRWWSPFLRGAIRQQHGLGFVAWTVRTLATGEKIPEVLPLGTFTWVVEPEKGPRSTLRYRVQLSGIEAVPFHVTEWAQPSLNVTEGSILHATVPTPLSHLIEEYKILRETMKRHHHADAWNTTARIVVSNDPKEFNHAAHEKEVFETLDFLKDAMESKRRLAPTAVDEAFLSRGTTNHREAVYTLPIHHHLEAVPQLKPTTDLEYLHVKFRHSVCSLLGIPSEMVLADRTGQRESRGGRSTSRLFQTKMMRVCEFLKGLMEEVYERIYKEKAEFNLLAMPRLEIQGIEDLKILHEIGVLQPDHTLGISELLLGKLRKRKREAAAKGGDTDKGGEKKAGFLSGSI
jgi:hypothetical protein